MEHSEILERSITNVTPKSLAEKKLMSGKPLNVYFGIDPTGAKLHLGHSVPLRKVKQFINAGHNVTFLIGSFTAMIGDPTGKDQMRNVLDSETIAKNFATYQQQASKIIDFSKVQVVYNHEWLSKLTFQEVTELAAHATVQQMIERDMFQKRLEQGKPIHLHEFFYPLMQGYDSVVLDVDCEIGGNDQYFNMLMGRTLQAAYNKREKFVLTTKLIDGPDGQKMSKTFNNCIWLEDEAHDMFGKIMSMKDELITLYMETCTDIPLTEIDTIEEKMKAGENPKQFKVQLAKAIVALYHSTAAADEAETAFAAQFSQGQVPDDMPDSNADPTKLLLDVLLEQGIIESKSSGRRLLEQGAIKKDDITLEDTSSKAEAGVYKVGKRKYIKLQ